MSRELIENLLEYADIAEAGDKPHWALAMRQAAEYIRADLAKPLPEPDAFIVLDSSGDHVYSSPHKQFCHDHINDLLMRDIEVDDSFVVRGFYSEPQARKLLTESSQDRTKKYFSYYPEGDFELHNSAEEAKKSAEDALDTEREYACEGWSEYVDKICWGEVRQHVVETMNRPRTDADHGDSEFATIVDYGLVDVGVTTEDHPHGIKGQE